MKIEFSFKKITFEKSLFETGVGTAELLRAFIIQGYLQQQTACACPLHFDRVVEDYGIEVVFFRCVLYYIISIPTTKLKKYIVAEKNYTVAGDQ